MDKIKDLNTRLKFQYIPHNYFWLEYFYCIYILLCNQYISLSILILNFFHIDFIFTTPVEFIKTKNETNFTSIWENFPRAVVLAVD